MSQAEPATAVTGAEKSTVRWDAVVVALLGLALLGAGFLDVRSYRLHRTRDIPQFTFVDPEASTRLVLDELYRTPDSFALLENFGPSERWDGPRFRQALGPASNLLLTTYHHHGWVRIEFYNFVPDRAFTLRCNDTVVEEFTHQPQGLIQRLYPVVLQPGQNKISFNFPSYNHAGLEIDPKDARPLAGGVFLKLDMNLD